MQASGFCMSWGVTIAFTSVAFQKAMWPCFPLCLPSTFCVSASHSVMFNFFATLWTVSRQASLSMELSRQEYWSGQPFPSPGESSWLREKTLVSYFGRQILYPSEPPGQPILYISVWPHLPTGLCLLTISNYEHPEVRALIYFHDLSRMPSIYLVLKNNSWMIEVLLDDLYISILKR